METNRLSSAFPSIYRSIRLSVFMSLIITRRINRNSMRVGAVCTGRPIGPIIRTTCTCILVGTTCNYTADGMIVIAIG